MHSPSKGKAKQDTQWCSGWWDFYPLLHQPQRPIAWSSTSSLFHPHPTQPLIIARHFSSSKQFNLPSPPPILGTPDAYDPPAVISASPNGEWLFAYFPSGEVDGIACLWQRAAPLDAWVVREYWSLSRGAGIVVANWLGGPREWIIDDAGTSTRHPPCGPRTPISNPTLLLVTESRWVTLCYLKQYATTLKMLSCPLNEPAIAGEGRPHPLDPSSSQSGSVKICTRAAIGLAFNESTIVIATRSRALPSPTKDNDMSSLDLALPLNLEVPSPEPQFTTDWDSWGEDQFIELCEVRLNLVGASGVALSTRPLPSLHGAGQQKLTNLVFVPAPPASVDAMEIPQETLYLAASYLDFGEYTSTPKSELVLYGLSQNVEQVSGVENRFWKCRFAATRSFTSSVLTYMTSSSSGQSWSTFGLFVGILNTSGPLPRDKNRVKKVKIGVTKVLKLPSLNDHERWDEGSIMSPIDSAGRNVPLNATLTHNNAMVLCYTPSSLGSSHIFFNTSPKIAKAAFTTDSPSKTFGSSSLVPGLLSGTSTTDLSHILANRSIPLNEVGEALSCALVMAENGQDMGGLMWRALGLVLETYRMRSLRVTSLSEREVLDARWQTAYDMCSLAACNYAFADCKEGEVFDLDAVWQLVGLSTWIVGFVEKLLQECVLASNPAGPSLESSQASASITLHLVHPIALQNLHAAVNHVSKFKDRIGSLSASEENSHIAKTVLVDLVECSGVNLNVLEPLLAELLAEAKKISVEEARSSLALCEITSSMLPHVQAAILKVAQAPVVNKPVLFVKPSELVDGVSQTVDSRKDLVKDVITKGVFRGRLQVVVCVRCGGKSEIGATASMNTHSSLRWRAWERMWTKHCICGGAWIIV